MNVTPVTPSQASTQRVVRIPARLGNEVVMLVSAVVALAWPMLYNGFPLYFPDSRVHTTMGMRWSGIPVFYNQLISPLFNHVSPYCVPVLLAIITYAVIRIFLSQWVHRLSILKWLAIIAVMALLTRISWLTSMLMPDLLGGLGLLAMLALMTGPRPLRPVERGVLLGVVLIALLSQTSSLLILPAVAVGIWLVHRLLARAQVQSLPALVLVWLAAMAMVTLDNHLHYQKSTLNANGPAIFFAKLANRGLAQEYLRVACPSEKALVICSYLPEMEALERKPGGQSFLWQKFDSRNDYLADALKAYGEGSAEIRSLNWRILYTYPLQAAAMSLADSAELFAARGEVLGKMRPWWNHPQWDAAFMKARQQAGTLVQAPFNLACRIAYTLGVACLLLLLVRPRTPPHLRATIASVLLMLVVNAVAHASLVGPYARYQDKVAFIPVLMLLALWQADASARQWRGPAHVRSTA